MEEGQRSSLVIILEKLTRHHEELFFEAPMKHTDDFGQIEKVQNQVFCFPF